MRPFLFEGTFLETPTYYVLYLLGFLGGILLGTWKARRDGLNPVRAVDLGMEIFLGGVLGARLFHIIVEAPDYYFRHPIRIFYFWQGGFVLYGGLIVATVGGILFMKYLKEPIGRWADVVAPCFYLGLGIGRAGCLSAGCCHGKETTWPWGMIFSDPRSAAPLHIPLHPTQAIEMIYAFLATFAFLKIFPGPTKKPGMALVLAFMSYAIFRFFIEFLRGDLDRGFFFNQSLSTSQIISILTVLGGLFWFYKYRKISL